MDRRILAATAVCLGAAISPAASANAQKTTVLHQGAGGSVHVRSEWTIAGAAIAIEYGRPSLKGRGLETLIPPGRVWRLGADEATTFRTSRPIVVGESRLAAGAYSLYAIPGAREWQLIVNQQTGQWGTSYDDRADVIRIPLSVSTSSENIEQLTIAIDITTDGGMLSIAWGRVRAQTSLRASAEAVTRV